MATFSTQAATREYQMDANGELTVVERLASLLETGQFADVTIRVGQGNGTATFKAHRLLLATASQPLNNLITSSNKNNGPGGETNTIHINDVEPEAFFNVLKYIYTDNLQISSITEAFALLRMSKTWGLNKLVKRTFTYLEGFLELYEPSTEDKKNELCDLLVLTEGDESILNKKAWDILLRDVNKVVPCQGFLNFTEAMVRQLLNRNDFDFKNQLTLFEAIRDWGMNQVLTRNLSVNQLQQVIEEFMVHVDFKAINDGDFIDTVITSECLSKGDLIAFFIARGLEIPRDLAFNNNKEDSSVTKDGSTLNYEKTRRFKRGYKLPTNEIYKEHELRFRVDKRLKLLGVGFGFLFSNTDMGITVHCQGPWESRQWSDIIQTYCRVSWEKMKTADVRLMFSEAVNIEPNQCYKILVRVTRMSAGTADVDLWGGSQGNSSFTMKDAEFDFLKAAVDPHKQVEEQDKENQPGMITDLFYQICDDSEPHTKSLTSPISQQSSPTKESSPPVYSLDRPKKKSPLRELTPPPPLSVHRSQRTAPPPPPRRISTEIIETFTVSKPSSIAVEAAPSVTTSKIKPMSYGRTISSTRYDGGSSVSDTLPWQRKREDSSSLYTRSHPFSSTRAPNRLPDFLSKTTRQPSTERGTSSWESPSKLRSETSAALLKSREPSINREREASQPRFGSSSTTSSRYGTSSISDITSRYTPRYGSALSTSRFSSVTPPSRYSGATSSYSPTSTSRAATPSRYGSSSVGSAASSRYGDSTTSKYGGDSTTSKYGGDSTTSKYGGDSTTSKYGGDSTTSKYGGDSTASKYGGDSTASKYGGDSTASKYGGDSTTSKYGGDSTTSKYGGDSTRSRYGGDSAPSRYGTATSSRFGKSESITSSRYGGDTSINSRISGDSPSSTSPRFGTSTNTGSRYSSGLLSPTNSRTSTSSPTPSTTTTSTRDSTSSALGRFGGTSTSLGSRYSGSNSRYGSSFYRR